MGGIDVSGGTQGALTFPTGDFTGDGRPDIGLVTAFLIAKGNGSGFDKPVLLATGWGEFDVVVGALDWDGDGTVGNFDGSGGDDILARSADSKLYLYSGTGTGELRTGVQIDSGWRTFHAIL